MTCCSCCLCSWVGHPPTRARFLTPRFLPGARALGGRFRGKMFAGVASFLGSASSVRHRAREPECPPGGVRKERKRPIGDGIGGGWQEVWQTQELERRRHVCSGVGRSALPGETLSSSPLLLRSVWRDEESVSPQQKLVVVIGPTVARFNHLSLVVGSRNIGVCCFSSSGGTVYSETRKMSSSGFRLSLLPLTIEDEC